MKFQPFIIAHMQLFAVLLTEIANIYLICQQDNAEDVVLNFVALAAISEVDNKYAASLIDLRIRYALEHLPVIDAPNI